MSEDTAGTCSEDKLYFAGVESTTPCLPDANMGVCVRQDVSRDVSLSEDTACASGKN